MKKLVLFLFAVFTLSACSSEMIMKNEMDSQSMKMQEKMKMPIKDEMKKQKMMMK